MSQVVSSSSQLQVVLVDISFTPTDERESLNTLSLRLKTEPGIYPQFVQASLTDQLKWRNKLELVVKSSQAVVVCISAASLLEEAVIQQSIRSIVRYSWPVNLHIVLLRLEPCEIPPDFNQNQTVDYFEENGYESLLEALRIRREDLGLLPRKPFLATSDDSPAQPSIITNPPPVVLPRKFLRHEAERERLLRELQDLKTTPKRRKEIGERLDSIGDTRRGVGVRADWLPDIVWLPVTPGGQLTMRQMTYRIQPFFIAKYPITYAQYKTFINAKNGYFSNMNWWQGIPEKFRKKVLMTESPEQGNKPRNHLNFYQALIFSRWLNYHMEGLKFSFGGHEGQSLIIGQNAQVRLPLHEEWQWAAQGGTEARAYPWGEWQEGYANTYEAELWRITSVGMFPQGAALCGAEDMYGNLWERCLTVYPGYSRREVLGGDRYWNVTVIPDH